LLKEKTQQQRSNMSDIFNSNLITESPVRSLGIVAAALVPLGIFSASAAWPVRPQDSDTVVGRPAPAVFGVMWVAIGIIIAFVGVVAAFRFDTVVLAILSVVFLLVAVVAVAWIYFNYVKDDQISVQMMGCLVLLTVLAFTLCLNATTDIAQDESQMVTSALLVLPVAWSIFATMLGMTKANKKKSRIRYSM
jgi:tryptophan-rich sensory protein